MKTKNNRYKEAVLVSLFLCLWVSLPFWSLVLLQAVNIQDDIYASDLNNNMLPCRVAAGRQLRKGELPTWTSGIYTGFPLLAEPETGALYPTNVLFFSLFPPYAAMMLAQILALLIAGCSFYVLARQLRLPVASALLGAGAFCLSGFFVSHLRHPSMIDAACWIPLQLFLVERIVGHVSPRAPLWLAVVWALQLLAGHPQISYYTGLILLAVLIVRWRQRDRRAPGARSFWPLRFVRDNGVHRWAVALVLGSAVASAQLIPTTELAQLGARGGGLSYAEASIYPPAPRNIATLIAPRINGDPSDGTYTLSAAFWEEYVYLGLLPFFLALAGIVFCWRRRPVVRVLVVLLVISYLLALGKNTPLFHVAYEVIPGMKYFRFPTRFLVFVELALALLAAFGLAELLRRIKHRWIRGLVALSALSLTAADLWYQQPRQVPLAPLDAWTAPIATERFLNNHASHSKTWRYYSLEAMRAHAMTYRENRGWAASVRPYVQLREMLQPSFNLLFGLEAVDGYVNMVPTHIEAVWASASTRGWIHPPGRVQHGFLVLRLELVNALRAFNVKFLVSPYRLRDPRLMEVFDNHAGVAVYRVEGTLPRAFVVGHTVQVSSAAEARRVFATHGFDPALQAVVHEPVDLPSGSASSGDVTYEQADDTHVRLHLKLKRPGLLVLSESYYPGWRATLDGADVPIVRANVMMKAVVVPAGIHEVIFRYTPTSVHLGLGITAMGLLGLFLWGWRCLKIKSKQP